MDVLKKVVQGEVTERTMGPPHWQDGICSCTQDMGVCCQTIWCAPCTASNMIHKRDHGMPNFDCVACICFLLGSYATGNRFPLWLGMAFRRELVQRYGIRNETTCNTCMLGICCAPCVYCQVQREMGKRKEHCGGCCANPPEDAPSMSDKVMKAAGNMMNNGLQAPKDWGSGICGCSCMECLEGVFCPCCVFGYVSSQLDSNRIDGAAPSGSQKMDVVSCCGSLFYLQGWTYANRREIIEKYNIFGETHIMSLFKVLCCPFCTILQQRREMGYNGEYPGGLCVKEAPARP